MRGWTAEDEGRKANRIPWLDAVKGFGIICVMLGHMTIPETLRQFVFSFHMPLFFFVSGYLYHGANNNGRWILRKLDALLVPYLIYGFLEIAVSWSCRGFDLHGLVVGLLKGNGAGVTWFLMCLLLTELCGSALVSVTVFQKRTLSAKFLAVLGVSIIGWYMPKLPMPSICMMKTIGAALSFWFMGIIARDLDLDRVMKTHTAITVAMVAPVMAIAFLLSRMQRIDMASATFGNPILFYMTAYMMIAVLFVICRRWRWIGENRLLGYMGMKSLLFMGLHNLIPPVMLAMLLALGVDVNSSHALKILSRCGNLGLLFLVVAICDRFIPTLAGRRRFFCLMTNKKTHRRGAT